MSVHQFMSDEGLFAYHLMLTAFANHYQGDPLDVVRRMLIVSEGKTNGEPTESVRMGHLAIEGLVHLSGLGPTNAGVGQKVYEVLCQYSQVPKARPIEKKLKGSSDSLFWDSFEVVVEVLTRGGGDKESLAQAFLEGYKVRYSSNRSKIEGKLRGFGYMQEPVPASSSEPASASSSEPEPPKELDIESFLGECSDYPFEDENKKEDPAVAQNCGEDDPFDLPPEEDTRLVLDTSDIKKRFGTYVFKKDLTTIYPSEIEGKPAITFLTAGRSDPKLYLGGYIWDRLYTKLDGKLDGDSTMIKNYASSFDQSVVRVGDCSIDVNSGKVGVIGYAIPVTSRDWVYGKWWLNQEDALGKMKGDRVKHWFAYRLDENGKVDLRAFTGFTKFRDFFFTQEKSAA